MDEQLKDDTELFLYILNLSRCKNKITNKKL